MLTLEQLKAMPPHTAFATGEVPNSEDGVYMTNNDIGRTLRWVAVRGGHWDWVIVCLWASSSTMEYVKEYGDKITSEKNIKKLVPCNDEAYNMYRY